MKIVILRGLLFAILELVAMLPDLDGKRRIRAM
jgi:hypothetical protein